MKRTEDDKGGWWYTDDDDRQCKLCKRTKAEGVLSWYSNDENEWACGHCVGTDNGFDRG